MVRRVTGRRLDMFSRRPIEGLQASIRQRQVPVSSGSCHDRRHRAVDDRRQLGVAPTGAPSCTRPPCWTPC